MGELVKSERKVKEISEESADLLAVEQANKANQERLSKERKKANASVIRTHRLKKE